MNRSILFTFVMPFFVLPVTAGAQELIYLDPGHTLEAPGVIGTCGTKEVWVNDQITLKLTRLLQAGGYKVQFSRVPNVDKEKISSEPGREPPEGLRARGERANKLKAKLFVSIHHDSASETALVKSPDACPGQEVTDPLAISSDFLKSYQVGFNVFIHNAEGRKFESSLRFAKLIGKGFVDQGQTPSNFHLPEVEESCGSCVLEDPALGVMSRNLAVIRTPTMPAVLIEVTNLRIPEFERNANDSTYQDMIAQTIKQAIDAYFGKE